MLQKIISVSNSVDLLLNFCVRIVNAAVLSDTVGLDFILRSGRMKQRSNTIEFIGVDIYVKSD